jgi:immunoglobulin-binding protein 1
LIYQDVLSFDQVHLQLFIHHLDTYCVVPEGERVLYAQTASSIQDAAKRRKVKIKQFKVEKDLSARVEAIRKRRKQTPMEDESQTNFDIIRSLLPAAQADEEDEEDSETDEILRETVLLLLRINYAQAHSQLESMDQELELLRTAPPLRPGPPVDDRRNKANDQDDMWKLDTKPPIGESGPLLDSSGKVPKHCLLPVDEIDHRNSPCGHLLSSPRAHQIAHACKLRSLGLITVCQR